MEEKNNAICLDQLNEFSFAKKIKKVLKKYYWYFFGVGVLIFALLCFFNLGKKPIFDWDEARHGINAYEMLRHNSWFANYFQDEYDYWNLKPPISYWGIMLGYKIFGYNTFGMRFFSALSMLIVCVIVALFLKFKNKDGGELASVTSLILFISCSKLLEKHCIRTGDADAYYILFFTIAIISLMTYKRNIIYLYLCGLCFSLMFLTKSYHSCVLIPIVFFYLLFTRGFKKIKWWQILIFFGCSILLIVIWAVIRYSIDGSAFFKEMFWYDLFSRTQGEQGENVQPLKYYLGYVFSSPSVLSVGFIFIVITLILKFKTKEKLNSITKMCIISFLSIFTIYAISKVKLYWYLFPIYVPFILMISDSVEKYAFSIFNKKYLTILKSVTYSLACIGIACSVALSFFYVFKQVKETKSTYAFVQELSSDIEKGATLYYQDSLDVIETINETPDRFEQAQILYLEFSLDAHTRYGKEELEKIYTIQQLQAMFPGYDSKQYNFDIDYSVFAFLANKNNNSNVYIIVDSVIYEKYSTELQIVKSTEKGDYYLCK